MLKIDLRLEVILAAFIFPGLFFSQGCNAPKRQLAVFDQYLETGNCDEAIAFSEGRIDSDNKAEGEELLWTLQLGSVERMRRNYSKSTEYFDRAEEMLKDFDFRSGLGDAAGATLVNENVIPYKGEEYDGVMVNTYKALNFMIEGRDDLARVEFNRALGRQQRAKQFFNAQIRKRQAELNKKEAENKFVKDNVENPQVSALVQSKYPGIYNFRPYPDFVNPFATYMAGVFFDLLGDYSKAVDLLKESYGMVEGNSYIAEDLSKTEEILSGKGRLENTVWLIFENGLGPIKKEFRIDIPLFVATNKVKYVGIALPKLEFRSAAYEYLEAETAGNRYKTEKVADMDRVIQTEFKKDFEGILHRAIISTTLKAVAQYALEKQNSRASSIGSLLTAVYSYATTAADVRIWTALPKDFQVARFEKPKDGKLKIIRPGDVPFEIKIPDCNNAIVYIKIVNKQAVPEYEVIGF